MSGSHVIAIDLGTGSARAVAFDRSGNQVGVAVREWSHRPEPGVAGSRVFATDAGWQLVQECVREVLATTGLAATDIAAVGTTSMREGIVLFDDAGAEIWACPNVDARAGAQAAELVRAGLAQKIYERAGDWVSITSPARLWWLRDHAPDVLSKAATIGMLSDWATYRLCGRHVTEPSAGSSSGLFDLAAQTWSTDILGWLDVDARILPEVVRPGTVIGGVTPLAAEGTGLAPGTPVVTAGADTQLALVGLGGAEPGTATVIGGTFWQATSLEATPVIDPRARLRTLCHSESGQWMIEGIGFYTGHAMRWFRDAFYAEDVAAARGHDPSAYQLMERGAQSVPIGSGGVLAIFANVMDAKRWVQAPPSFVQFDLDADPPTGRAHCFRAMEEAGAYVTRRHVEIVEEVVGRQMSRICFTGGASQGALWAQILADVCGLPVDVPVVKESTARGAAAYAAVGAGWAGEAGSAFSDAGRIERTFEPTEAAHRAYAEHYQRWQHVYSRMLDLAEDGSLRPMWWPPGVAAPPAPICTT